MLRMRTLVQLVALIVIVTLAALPSVASPAVTTAATAPGLGMASTFSVLAATSMDAANPTTISGDLGLSTGLAAQRTGTWVVGGMQYFGPSSLAATARTDALGAWTNMAGQPSSGTWSLNPNPVPGVWTAASSATFNGALTLSGGPTDIWVFQISTDFTFNGSVIMAGGAQPCNVFWQIARDTTIASGSTFVGTLIAGRDVTLVSSATVSGRILSLDGALTTDGNTIIRAICAPGINTQIHDANHTAITSAPIGTIVHDQAAVTGSVGITPTGTVSFTVYANQTCAGVGTPAGVVALNGAGVADPSNTATLTSAGLSYLAHYTGDVIYDAGDGPCEVLVPLALSSVTTQIHDASHAVVTFAPVGTIVHDQAAVTGTLGIPTGLVNFTVYANLTCAGVGTPAGAVALNGAGVADPSNTATLTSAGLSYLAHYTGDAIYNAADGPCEVLVPLALSAITTQIHDANHAVVTFAPIGTIVHDQAAVTGTLGIPTGTVSFTVYANQNCSGVGASAGTVALNGAGVADPSNTAILTNAGLSYKAHYTGDAIYNAIDGPCEVLAPMASSGIYTQIHDASHAVVTIAPVGTIVHDMAAVTGTLGIPTGTVSFTVYANLTCAGVGTPAGVVTLNGAGVADPSNTATLTSAGLSYLAHYNGDPNYTAADGPCEVLAPLALQGITTQIHDANHAVVTFAPIGTIVHDQAAVTGTLGIPTGTVNFTVYANQTCAGVGTSAGAVALNGAGVADPSNTATLTSAGLSYRAHYNGNAIYTAADGPCEVLVPLALQSITTQIHDANHVVITSAPIGTIVHDMATVTGTLGIPTGTVNFTVYANLTCAGVGTFAGAVALNSVGVADPSNTATLTSAGLSFKAHYNGNATYTAADGPCEVLVASPTAVQLLYFQANPLSGQQVQLKWATALEVDNFGFNLYRANVDDVDVARASLPIHFEPAVTQGSGSGATYVYVDTAPSAGPWWYWLSDVDTKGIETFHNTPINITVQSNNNLPYRVYLPFTAKGSGN